jgi:hypothetical protein
MESNSTDYPVWTVSYLLNIKWTARWKWQKFHIFYLLYCAANVAFEVTLHYPHLSTISRTHRTFTGLMNFFRDSLLKRMWTLHIIGGNREKPFLTLTTIPKRTGLFAAMLGCHMREGNQQELAGRSMFQRPGIWVSLLRKHWVTAGDLRRNRRHPSKQKS